MAACWKMYSYCRCTVVAGRMDGRAREGSLLIGLGALDVAL
jgi:hypothetical protein